MLAILSLLVVLVMSFLVTRIASSALVHTGLSRQVARFQARSALTGAGFTTAESERLVDHPVRRRILMMLMLVGNAGIITAVSSLLLAFIGEDPGAPLWLRVTLLVTGLIGLWALASSHAVERVLSRWIDRMLVRYTTIEVRDFGSLLGLAGDYRIVERNVGARDWLIGKTLAEAALPDEGVLVLALKRKDGTFLGTPDGAVSIRADDLLVLYGHLDALERLDHRSSGPGGELDHVEAVAEQAHEKSQESGETRERDDSEAGERGSPRNTTDDAV